MTDQNDTPPSRRSMHPDESLLDYRVGCVEDLCKQILTGQEDQRRQLASMSERMVGGDGRLQRAETDIATIKETGRQGFIWALGAALTAVATLVSMVFEFVFTNHQGPKS